jgi:phosphoglycolate phosphatase-like HAD superfamily hydrolase
MSSGEPNGRSDIGLSRRKVLVGSALVGAAGFGPLTLNQAMGQTDPLPAWNEGAAKTSIIDFVSHVTTRGENFIPPTERIAVFDNDGTLWSEQPMYTQAFFVLHRMQELAPQHPAWKQREPYASLLRGDMKRAAALASENDVAEVMAVTHAGMTTEEFEAAVVGWISTAKHPQTGRLFSEMVYQPMLELLTYLRANEFKTFIVSGGGIEFMRPWTERVYGIPPEQVIGTSGGLRFERRGDSPVLLKLPTLVHNDDNEGKPVGIQRHIGRRPIAAFGNSDGDLQMLQWTAAGRGPRFCLYVHHTDADREWAYDRASHVGRLDKGLDEAKMKGWIVASMKDDWKLVYP